MAKLPETIEVKVTWQDTPLTRAIEAEAVAAERERISEAIKASDLLTTGWTRETIRTWLLRVVAGEL